MMEKINNNPTLKISLEGAVLLLALIGTFYLGNNIAKIEFSEISSNNELMQTASVVSATNRDVFAGYEYVLIDNTKGIKQIKTK